MIKKLVILMFFLSAASVTDLLAEYTLSGKLSHDSRVLLDKGIHSKDPGDEDGQRGEFNKSISRLELNVQRVDEEGFSMFGKVWLTCDHLESYYARTYQDNDTSSESNLERLEYDEFMLREGYVTAAFGAFEMKAGQMILNWGRTDEINPVDVVNPEDLSEFYTIDKMERKIPVMLFDGLLYMGDFTLQAVWLPFFEPAVVPSQGPWAQSMLLEFRKMAPDLYASLDFNDRDGAGRRDINNSETAARLSGLVGSFDFGLVFFYGYNDQPAVKIDFANKIYDIIYKQYHGYGFDFAYSSGGCGFRGEFFYRDRILYPHETPSGIDNYESQDFQGIIGADKTYGENLYVNLQVMYTRIFDYKDDILMEEDLVMGMGTVEKKFFREELTVALDFYYGFREKDWMIGPRIEYALTDNFKAKLSGFIVDGPLDSDLGQFKNNDMIILQIAYNF